MMPWLTSCLLFTQVHGDEIAHNSGLVGGAVGLLIVVERIVKLMRNGNGHERQMLDKLNQIVVKLSELNGRLAGRGD
mgnify:CR=1 FL=1